MLFALPLLLISFTLTTLAAGLPHKEPCIFVLRIEGWWKPTNGPVVFTSYETFSGLGGIPYFDSQMSGPGAKFELWGLNLYDHLPRKVCYIYSQSKQLICNGHFERNRNRFSLSYDYLLHDGREHWLACLNLKLLGSWDIYSDERPWIPGCYKVKLRDFGQSNTCSALESTNPHSQSFLLIPTHTGRIQVHPSSKDSAIVLPQLSISWQFSLNAIGGTDGLLDIGSHRQTRIIQNGHCTTDYVVNGHNLIATYHYDYCYIHPTSLELLCDSDTNGISLGATQFTLAENGTLLHDGRANWLACPRGNSPDHFNVYSDHRAPSRGCSIIQINAGESKCAIFGPSLNALPTSVPPARTETSTSSPPRPATLRPCIFGIDSVGSYSGVVRSSLDGSIRIDSGFQTGEHRFIISEGILTDSRHHQHCFIHPATLEFRCDSEERAKLSTTPTKFTLSDKGYLLHDGRADWKACINQILLGAYDLFSDRKTSSRLCHPVQLRTGVACCPTHQAPLLSLVPTSVLSDQGESSVATASPSPSRVCPFKLNITGTNDPNVSVQFLSYEYNLSGKNLLRFNFYTCFIDSLTLGFDCLDRSNPELRKSWDNIDFALAANGNLLHNGRENWVVCKFLGKAWWRLYSDEKRGNPECQIVQLRATGINCKVLVRPGFISLSRALQTPTVALAARGETIPSPPVSTPYTFSLSSTGDTFAAVNVIRDGTNRLYEESSQRYILSGNRLQDFSYGRECFIHESTFQFLCVAGASNLHVEPEFSLDKHRHKYLLHQGRYNWLVCPELRGRPSLWSDKKPNSGHCHTVQLRVNSLSFGDWSQSNSSPPSLKSRTVILPVSPATLTLPGRAKSPTSSTSKVSPTSSMREPSCPTGLTGTPFESPHLIILVSPDAQSHAFGISYSAAISKHNSTIFNFDIPATTPYVNNTCALIFLFPESRYLAPTRGKYNVSGLEHQEETNGGLAFSRLEGPADIKTTWENMPNPHALGDVKGMAVNIKPGNSYVIGTGPCESGKTVAFMIGGKGSIALSYFQNSAPSAIGLYMVPCS